MTPPSEIDSSVTPYLPADCSASYDSQFKQAPKPLWLPWVGCHWNDRPLDRRLLIVGESFYADELKQPDSLQVRSRDRNYARKVVSECLINDEWGARTLCNIPKLLFGTSAIERHRFWGDTAYFNLVRRAMNSSSHRPTCEDFCDGWSVAFRIFEILRPSFCLMLGLTAAKSFNHSAKEAGLEASSVSVGTKVGRTSSRRATLRYNTGQAEFVFVQHPGRYFSWRRWHNYLNTEHANLMSWIREAGYPLGNP
jgi:hypothetical protein